MYAIIEDSGTQFKITAGQVIKIDRKVAEGEKTVTFDRVLLVAGEGQPRVGNPIVGGATVTAEVLGPVKGPKVTSIKHRRRKGYYRKTGHRQKYTSVKISAISA
ncbi:MAG TPA: 50S ribosomal protein L21 [Tepidisphaeraceae bacterium]|jgi:large subunit ribosomal protein L21